MEDNNYIAVNSCLILIGYRLNLGKIFPYNGLHTEQILKEKDNKDECPSGYGVEVRFKKISDSL